MASLFSGYCRQPHAVRLMGSQVIAASHYRHWLAFATGCHTPPSGRLSPKARLIRLSIRRHFAATMPPTAAAAHAVRLIPTASHSQTGWHNTSMMGQAGLSDGWSTMIASLQSRYQYHHNSLPFGRVVSPISQVIDCRRRRHACRQPPHGRGMMKPGMPLFTPRSSKAAFLSRVDAAFSPPADF